MPTTIVDFDQDTASNTFTMTILDGDNPVIENVTGLSLDEAGGVDQGSQEGAAVTSGTGSITTAVGSDIIDHYELEPTEFNVGGELQSQGQVVQLEIASESNGVRTYEASSSWMACVSQYLMWRLMPPLHWANTNSTCMNNLTIRVLTMTRLLSHCQFTR